MFKKNQTVFYVAGADLVKAKVLTAHQDGTCKVEAQFYYEEGKTVGQYLGFVFDGVTVYQNAMDAVNGTRRERAPEPQPMIVETPHFPRPGELFEEV